MWDAVGPHAGRPPARAKCAADFVFVLVWCVCGRAGGGLRRRRIAVGVCMPYDVQALLDLAVATKLRRRSPPTTLPHTLHTFGKLRVAVGVAVAGCRSRWEDWKRGVAVGLGELVLGGFFSFSHTPQVCVDLLTLWASCCNVGALTRCGGGVAVGVLRWRCLSGGRRFAKVFPAPGRGHGGRVRTPDKPC